MGGLAPGKLKSRRGWPSSPRRLIHGCYFFDPGFKNSLREKLYQLCGNGDTSSPSTRGGLAYSGPPKWPCLSPPPAQVVGESKREAIETVGNEIVSPEVGQIAGDRKNLLM